MADGIERRRHERWEQAEGVYCYLDGTRFDADSLNLSTGGVFLKTNDLSKPVGSRIALVFKFQNASGQEPVFLVGRVVRHQTWAPLGMGVQWERAVTAGSTSHLALFLLTILRIDAEQIALRPHGKQRGLKAVYFFGETPAEETAGTGGAATTASLRPPERPGSPASPPSFPEPELPGNVEASSSYSERGPLTTRITDADLRAATNMEVLVKESGATVTGRIRQLGIRSLLISFDDLPERLGLTPEILFKIRTRKGLVPVRCACVVTAVLDKGSSFSPAVEVRIERCDEGKHPGILLRFLRYLHFSSLTQGD